MNQAPSLPTTLEADVRAALSEDIGAGDVTASLLPPHKQCGAWVVCRERAVLAGAAWFERCFTVLDPHCAITWFAHDGEQVAADTRVCELHGSARALVSAERTALNFLQTLSATATVTRRYVDALGDSPTRILDTRKTLPGLRAAQKYAVRCGGGVNHRMGLYDAILIKENHIAAAGSISAAVAGLRREYPTLALEVEVEDLAELDEALAAGVEMVLLDNFDLPAIRAATARVAGRAKIEISGGVDIAALPALARAGADFISIGALTKHVHAIDFSMRIAAI